VRKEHNSHSFSLIFHSLIFVVDNDETCMYNFYVLSNGTERKEFLEEGKKLGAATGRGTKFNVALGQTKAEDIEWLVIGCEFDGEGHKAAYVKFSEEDADEDNDTEQNITDGSSHLQSGLLTNLALTLSMSYFLMK